MAESSDGAPSIAAERQSGGKRSEAIWLPISYLHSTASFPLAGPGMRTKSPRQRECVRFSDLSSLFLGKKASGRTQQARRHAPHCVSRKATIGGRVNAAATSRGRTRRSSITTRSNRLHPASVLLVASWWLFCVPKVHSNQRVQEVAHAPLSPRRRPSRRARKHRIGVSLEKNRRSNVCASSALTRSPNPARPSHLRPPGHVLAAIGGGGPDRNHRDDGRLRNENHGKLQEHLPDPDPHAAPGRCSAPSRPHL